MENKREPVPSDFVPVGKRFSVVLEVTNPDEALPLLRNMVYAADSDEYLSVLGCDVIDVFDGDFTTTQRNQRNRIERAMRILRGDDD